MDNVLPFPRGETWSGATADVSDTIPLGLEGAIFDATDTEHGTSVPIKLRVVKNDSGGDLTAARQLMGWSTTSDTDLGRRSDGYTGAQGERCKPLDDAYAVGFTIPEDDLFYCLESGYCDVNGDGTAVDLTVGDEVCTQNDGTMDGTPATTGDYVFGTVAETTTAESTATLVLVEEGIGREHH